MTTVLEATIFSGGNLQRLPLKIISVKNFNHKMSTFGSHKMSTFIIDC